MAFKNTTLKIFMREDVFHPGNIVEGVVELSIPKGESVAYNSIRLTLSGKERSRRQVKKKVDGKEIKVDDTERYHFFKEVVVLAGEMVDGDETVGRTVNSGIYRYPFAYRLPMDIPASFSVSMGSKEIAEILYQAKAVVIKSTAEEMSKEEVKKALRDSKKGIIWDKPIRIFKTQRYFHVLRPMPVEQYNDKKTIFLEVPHHLRTFKCCSSGDQIHHVDIDRSVVAMDRDNLQVVINIDNTVGQKNVLGMQLKLKRNFIMRCNDYVKVKRDETVSKESFNISIQSGVKGILSGICPLPWNLVPSFRTFNMMCTYYLEIKVLMDGCADLCDSYPVTIVQTVDDLNSVAPLNFKENRYCNIVGAYVKDYAYVATTASTLMPFSPIPTDVPTGTPSKAVCAVGDGPVPLPSISWQLIADRKDECKPLVNGEHIKYEGGVYSGSLRQKQAEPFTKAPNVVFRSSEPDAPNQNLFDLKRSHAMINQPSYAAAPYAATEGVYHPAVTSTEPSVFTKH